MIPSALSQIAERAAKAAAPGVWSAAEQTGLVAVLAGLRWTPGQVADVLARSSPDPWHQLVVHAGVTCQSSVFVLPAGATIPLHDHPGMTVLCRMLSGRMRVHSYRWFDIGRRLATDHGVADLDPWSPVSKLLPDPGELHQITALTDCAFFDVCTPYYDDGGGRPCRYYAVTGRVGRDVVEMGEVERRARVGGGKQAIVLVEARGAAIQFQEDSNLSLLQAGLVARRLVTRGYRVALRMIIDAGQSIEEYSVLCHAPDHELDRLRTSVATARRATAARRAVVAEIRDRHLPVAIGADSVDGVDIEDRLFHAALISRVVGVNEEVVGRIRASRHPLVGPSAMDGYEEMLHRSVGRPYLDLEATVARAALERCVDGTTEVEISTVSRPGPAPASWLTDPICARLVQADLTAKAGGREAEDFKSRLIGLFTTVGVDGEERPYFNSPTCCRYEHGKVRLIPRDRFGILGLRGSERLTFGHLRRLIREQSDGRGSRPLALKYPYTAEYLAASIGEEAKALASSAEVTVVFVEGVTDTINPGTGGLLDCELSSVLAGSPVRYRRLSAQVGSRRLLPSGPGGLPLIHDRLERQIAGTFPESFRWESLEGPAEAPLLTRASD